jgi:hypothetical protein
MIRRRQWSLKTMLMLPVVAGIVMLAVLIAPADRQYQSFWDKLVVAFVGTGPVMFGRAVLAPIRNPSRAVSTGPSIRARDSGCAIQSRPASWRLSRRPALRIQVDV